MVVKGAVGFLSGSRALVADALHSLSDLFSDVIVLASLKLSLVPSDKSHPYGHGRFESLGALAVSLVLLLSGLVIMLDAIKAIIEKQAVSYGLAPIFAAVLSMSVKEILFRLTILEARKTSNDALLANAWHHRSDALSSLAVLIGVAGNRLGIPLMDPVAACVVSLMVAYAAIKIFRKALGKLTDEAVPLETIRRIEKAAGSVDQVMEAHDVRARWMGGKLLVDLHILVDPLLRITESHCIGEKVRTAIADAVPEVEETMVHVEPGECGRDPAHSLSREQVQKEMEGILDIDGGDIFPRVAGIHYRKGKPVIDLEIGFPDDTTIKEAAEGARCIKRLIEARGKFLVGNMVFSRISGSHGGSDIQ